VNRITYPLRVPGISGFAEFFIIFLDFLRGVLSGVKCTLISGLIHYPDKKGFAGYLRGGRARDEGLFLFAKTDCLYIV